VSIWLPTERFGEALALASHLHREQIRKGADIPYISHLLAVSALVIEHDGDEDQAIAALLHDAVEDQGGMETAGEIERRFGKRVARIVLDCTDAHTTPKPPWRARKEAYLASLHQKPPDSLLVSLADKTHNASAIRRDLQRGGPSVWSRFSAGRDGSLWYYRALADVFAEVMPGSLAGELDRAVADIERLATG
jgi:(p)ppGpp synthase/HD superfamily hydrolase